MAVGYNEFIRNIYIYDYTYTRRSTIGKINVPLGTPMLEVDVSGDTIEIPCLGRMWTTKALKEKLNGYKWDTVKIPLYRLNPHRYIRGGSLSTIAKSASPLLGIFFLKTPHQYILSRKVGNDTPYLGGEGLIMYDNYRPLCLFSLLVEKCSEGYIIKKPILRINPEIFNNEDLMAKHIRTKMLSSIYGGISPIFSPYSEFKILGDINNNFEVIINEDINKFITHSRRPNINDSQESFNKFLVDNVNNIFI